MEEVERQIVTEFLKLGLVEKWLRELEIETVNAFGLTTPELVAKIEQYHTRRMALLAFQQFLESRNVVGDIK